MKSEALSLVFYGHMVDLPGRSTPRFPPEVEAIARIEIERRRARHTEDRSMGNVKAFASLARGGCILFHEICRNFGFDTVIVLPFSPHRFLRTSVEGAESGDWPGRLMLIISDLFFFVLDFSSVFLQVIKRFILISFVPFALHFLHSLIN